MHAGIRVGLFTPDQAFDVVTREMIVKLKVWLWRVDVSLTVTLCAGAVLQVHGDGCGGAARCHCQDCREHEPLSQVRTLCAAIDD